MKTIFVVTLFGTLTFAFADYPEVGRCQHYKPMSNLIFNDFLKETWFVTNAKHGSNSTVCRRYKPTYADGIVKLTGDGYYTFKEQAPFFRVRCKGQKNETHHCGKFSLHCKQTAEEHNVNIDFYLKVRVLETDYNNFAVMYMCAKFPPGQESPLIQDNFLVLQRRPRLKTDQDPRISATLKKHNLSLEDFLNNKYIDCPKLPQQNKGKN